jgi:hypothetical protein
MGSKCSDDLKDLWLCCSPSPSTQGGRDDAREPGVTFQNPLWMMIRHGSFAAV